MIYNEKMERINYNHLFYFYIIAKEGSIRAASERLHLSQPTLSDQLKLLEEQLGKLFERKNRSLVINRNGIIALEYAEKIFSLGHELIHILRENPVYPKSTFDVGVVSGLPYDSLYDPLLKFTTDNQIGLSLKENNRQYLVSDLELGQIDLVVSDTKESLGQNLSVMKMGVSKTYAVAHKKYSKLKKGFPHSMGGTPFCHYSNSSGMRYELDLFFRHHNFTPRILAEADDVDFFAKFIEKGNGVAILPESAMIRLTKNRDIINIGELKDLQTTIWAIYRANDTAGLGQQFIKQY